MPTAEKVIYGIGTVVENGTARFSATSRWRVEFGSTVDARGGMMLSEPLAVGLVATYGRDDCGESAVALASVRHERSKAVGTLHRTRLSLILAVCLSFFSGSASEAQTTQFDGSSRVHKLAIYFTSNGWFSCTARADELATFLAGNTEGQVFVVNHPTPASGLITVTLLVPREAGAAVADMVFALGAQGCPATYTFSDTSEMTCQERIKASEGGDFVELDQSGHFVAQVNQSTVVRLSPVPTGCARIQTEIVTGESP